MTAEAAILALGTVTLTGCGTGLVLVHGSNPLLKGLNWMGAALVVGGTAAALMLFSGVVPALLPAVNLCMLLAFVCCYRADRYLLGLETRHETLTTVLLAAQAIASALAWLGILGVRSSTSIVSALVAVQLGCTATLIQRNTSSDALSAARFTSGLMRLLALGNLLRGACATMGLLTNPRWADSLNLLTYEFFVAASIALAFAFFWRTTAKLSLDLEHMASTDPLTRVFNRRVFLNWCENEQVRSRTSAVPFSVLMVDFDHFKKINDSHGHHVGDAVLVAAVERIQDSIRGIDVLCRWGGEEFAVLLPNASEEATIIVAERIRKNIRSLQSVEKPFAGTRIDQLRLSASIGTATYLGGDDQFVHMLQRADAALYQAKRAGRDRVVSSHTNSASGSPSADLAWETL